MAYRIVLSDQATSKLDQSYVAVRARWQAIAKLLSENPFAKSDTDPIRCAEVEPDFSWCTYSSPGFPYIVLFMVERLPFGSESGVVFVSRLVERRLGQ